MICLNIHQLLTISMNWILYGTQTYKKKVCVKRKKKFVHSKFVHHCILSWNNKCKQNSLIWRKCEVCESDLFNMIVFYENLMFHIPETDFFFFSTVPFYILKHRKPEKVERKWSWMTLHWTRNNCVEKHFFKRYIDAWKQQQKQFFPLQCFPLLILCEALKYRHLWFLKIGKWFRKCKLMNLK